MIRTTKLEIATHDIVLVISAIFMLLYLFCVFSLENKKLNIQQDLEQAKIEAECKQGGIDEITK